MDPFLLITHVVPACGVAAQRGPDGVGCVAGPASAVPTDQPVKVKALE